MKNLKYPFPWEANAFSFPAKLLAYGYSYKIEVKVHNTKVIFEPDEERKWRALLNYEDLNSNKEISVELLKAIASSLDEILK